MIWRSGFARPASIKQIQLLAEMTDGSTSANIYANTGGTGSSDPLAANPTYGNLLVGSLKNAVASWPPPLIWNIGVPDHVLRVDTDPVRVSIQRRPDAPTDQTTVCDNSKSSKATAEGISQNHQGRS
jgi:hypothetical protein